MPTILITGANRGLGLEFARSYAADGWRVHACCRHPEKAKDLSAVHGDIVVHRLDVTDGLQVAGLARELIDVPIDVLLNNAGAFGPRTGFGEIDYDAWQPVFALNVFAPLRMAERFVGHIAESERKQIINITSYMGSITESNAGGSYIYRSSKAALNMIAKCLSVDLAPRGITVVNIHPGWVRTDMGGENASLSPAESVAAMRKVFGRLTFKDNGSFLNHDGSTIPW